MEGLKNDTGPPELSLQGPEGAVAISGRHCRFVPVAVKMAETKSQPVAAVTAQPLAALPPYGCGVPFTGGDRPVGGAFNGRKALVHRCTCLTCHSEERSDVGISQYLAG